MNKVSVYLDRIIGSGKNIDSERKFLIITCLVATIFLLFLCSFHIVMGLGIKPVIYAGTSAISTFILYLILRYTSCLFIPKIILTIMGFVLLDLTWYTKFLSQGPVLFFIFAFGALLLWVWHGKSLAIIVALYIINIVVLYLIEKSAPAGLMTYPLPKLRSEDIYLSFFMYSSLMIFLLWVVKREFIREKDKAIASDKLKSAFLANVSHEIRTPLNSILGFSKLLNYTEQNIKRKEYSDIIQNSGENLLRLINDILELSKIEAGDMSLEYIDFNVSELLEELKTMGNIELQKREKSEITINILLPHGDIVMHSDRFRIQQVLSNLLINSIKFTSSGTITMSCEKSSGKILFKVSDTGTGIPEQDQKFVFDRFVKFDYNNMNTEGSGIGLSIVSRIVEMLSGSIQFESKSGEGSTFSFKIPFIHPKVKAMKERDVKATEGIPFNNASKVILLVEDDKFSARLIHEILKPLNYNIIHVTDGKDAVEYIKTHTDTSLILLDIKLPRMNGYDAASLIRKFNSEIPIIAQTAYAIAGDREKALIAGCNEHISKPIDPTLLISLVNQYLSN
ncbi:MAG: response regulator [Bacteroidales bacterium]|nr:response regulator [Bacteroidales bacterium]